MEKGIILFFASVCFVVSIVARVRNGENENQDALFFMWCAIFLALLAQTVS